jgi:hypothetical protein
MARPQACLTRTATSDELRELRRRAAARGIAQRDHQRAVVVLAVLEVPTSEMQGVKWRVVAVQLERRPPHEATQAVEFGLVAPARTAGQAQGVKPSDGPVSVFPVDRLAVELAGLASAANQAGERSYLVSARCFPLGYPWIDGDDGRLLVGPTAGAVHAGYGDDWEQNGDLWPLKSVVALAYGRTWLPRPGHDSRPDLLRDAAHDLDNARLAASSAVQTV